MIRSMNQLTHLQKLEAESIHILREVVATSINPVMLYFNIFKMNEIMNYVWGWHRLAGVLVYEYEDNPL